MRRLAALPRAGALSAGRVGWGRGMGTFPRRGCTSAARAVYPSQVAGLHALPVPPSGAARRIEHEPAPPHRSFSAAAAAGDEPIVYALHSKGQKVDGSGRPLLRKVDGDTVRSQSSHPFKRGDKVERRDGVDEWRTGYVTKEQPLEVTISENPNHPGYPWDEVRAVEGDPHRHAAASTSSSASSSSSSSSSHPGSAGGLRVGARVRLRPGSGQRGCLRGGAVGTLLEDDGSDVPYKCEHGGQTYWYAARDIIAADDRPGARLLPPFPPIFSRFFPFSPGLLAVFSGFLASRPRKWANDG